MGWRQASGAFITLFQGPLLLAGPGKPWKTCRREDSNTNGVQLNYVYFKLDFFSKFIVFLCCYVSLLFSAESRLASLNFVHVRQKFPLVPLEHSVPRFPRSRESSPALNTCGTGWHRYCPEMWPSPIARSNQALQSRCTKTFPSTHDFRLPGLLDWRLGKGVFQNLPNYQIWLTSLNMYRLRLHTATAVSV